MMKSSSNDQTQSSQDAGQAAKNKDRQPGVEPVTKEHYGETTPSQGEDRVPRLPHERDESVDSQGGQPDESPSAEIIQQAFDDVQRGLVNTDRGLEAHVVKKKTLDGKK